MKIIAADDEIIALEVLVDAIKEAEPTAEVISFRNGRDVLDYIAENSCDVCFFDIEMRDINGIELAYEAKKFNPKINIVFVTGYSEYTKNAFEVRASGYVLKPVTAVKIAEIFVIRSKKTKTHMMFMLKLSETSMFMQKAIPLYSKEQDPKNCLHILLTEKVPA